MKQRIYIDTSVIGGCFDEDLVIRFWRSEVRGRSSMKKTFDAVRFQREARAELSRAYLENREAFLKDLKKRYGKLRKAKGRGKAGRRPAQAVQP